MAQRQAVGKGESNDGIAPGQGWEWRLEKEWGEKGGGASNVGTLGNKQVLRPVPALGTAMRAASRLPKPGSLASVLIDIAVDRVLQQLYEIYSTR